MAKNSLGFISYTSSATLHLVRGVIYDIQKSPHTSVAAKPLEHEVAALTHKIFLKSSENDSEFVLDVSYVPVDFSVGHKIEAIIDKSEDIYFLRNLNLDTEFLANADTDNIEISAQERQKPSNVWLPFLFIIGGIFLAAVFSNKLFVISGFTFIVVGILAIVWKFIMYRASGKVDYVNQMITLIEKLTSKYLSKKAITWPRPDGKAW